MDIIDVKRNRVRLKDLPGRLMDDGIVFLRNATVDSLSASLKGRTETFLHPHADQLGVTIIAPREQPRGVGGMKGFTNEALGVHTDRSATVDPPAISCTTTGTCTVVKASWAIGR